MDHEGLVLDKEGGIATLRLNRPEQLNAVSTSMERSIRRALNDISKDKSIKVLILTGTGRGFSAGTDINNGLPALYKMSEKELAEGMRSTALGFYDISKPTIAAINGVTAGVGLAMALLCDMRIASEKATFTPGYVRMGLTPDVASTYLLPRLVGTARAMEFMITGDLIDAAEAYRIGMLNKVVPEEELMKTARELATKIARGAPIAIELTKQDIRRSAHNSIEQQIELEASTFYTCLQTEDHKEAAKAFLEKRRPEFKGK